ncbi:bifunctional hydroxymethylpyrimidine kinase/phosphomethylpyrimidine kinase [Kiritimatiellaeota bacterium B1221]|nr:bifunctional hydroxymethylpyrimidine kinase/phosphomethylpyrimidine kinase [Kiritimatiellaeota bacterium B1221]
MTSFDYTNSDVPVVLTIASSDSGAGSGVQADLKTFSALDVFGTCAITAVTAQSPTEFRRMHALPADLVKEQIMSVSDGFPISAAKTGLLPTRELVEMVVEADEDCGIPILVVDPRMITSGGVRLMDVAAVEALKSALLPVARVVTPNVHECEILAGFPIGSVEDLRKAAQVISDKYEIACVATGGALPGEYLTDVLCDEGQISEFVHDRVKVSETHGAGCTYSAALTAMIAKGMLLTDAVQESRLLVSRALREAWHVGPHVPLHLSVR